jgi:type 1 glutamine amidotransferase
MCDNVRHPDETAPPGIRSLLRTGKSARRCRRQNGACQLNELPAEPSATQINKAMKTFSLFSKLIPVLASCALALGATAAEPKKVLVVSITKGFRHSSIATAEKVLTQLGKDSKAFTVVDYAQQPTLKVPQKPREPAKPRALAADADDDAKKKYQRDMLNYEAARIEYATQQAKWGTMQTEIKNAQEAFDQAMKESGAKLSAENLKKYDAVIFANTTGNLPLPDNQALIDWVKNGGAFIGMHSATDTYPAFRPYIEMIGGEFAGHGAQVGVECLVQDTKHPATKDLGESFCLEQEEIYLMKNYDPTKVRELLVLDKHPNKKKEAGRFPVAWCKEFGQGKVFYTSLGHNEAVWENKRYQKHILGGIKWALGLEKGEATPQTAAK